MPKFFIKDEQIQNNNIIIVGEDVKNSTEPYNVLQEFLL